MAPSVVHLTQYTVHVATEEASSIARALNLPRLTHRNTKHFCCAWTKNNVTERGRRSQNFEPNTHPKLPTRVEWRAVMAGAAAGAVFSPKFCTSLETLTA